jgi:2-desacetyl-2-hydroxyethyl bacteriochlorophyllide A dehydrogenase
MPPKPAWPRGVMRAVVLQGAGRVRVAAVPIPPLQQGTALVRVSYTGLCGTDLELLQGQTGYQRDGRTRFPHIPGHEWCGVVASVAGQRATLQPGDRVVGQTMVPCGQCGTCGQGRRRQCPDLVETGLYGLQGAAADYVRVPTRSLVAVPDAVSDRAAALIEPAVTVLEAFNRAGLVPGEPVAVVGTGTIGLLAVQMAARVSGHVDVIGVDPAGLELAMRCGASSACTAGQAVGNRHGRYPLVIEASGASAGFGAALDLTARGGRMAIIGVSSEPVVGFVPGDLVLRGIDVLAIQHGLDNYQRVIELMTAGLLDPEPLIADSYAAERAPEAFGILTSARSGAPKIMLSFAEESGIPQ